MRNKGFTIIDYINDYIGVCVPSVAQELYATLICLVQELGLSISQKKLLASSTQAVCL